MGLCYTKNSLQQETCLRRLLSPRLKGRESNSLTLYAVKNDPWCLASVDRTKIAAWDAALQVSRCFAYIEQVEVDLILLFNKMQNTSVYGICLWLLGSVSNDWLRFNRLLPGHYNLFLLYFIVLLLVDDNLLGLWELSLNRLVVFSFFGSVISIRLLLSVIYFYNSLKRR